MPAFVGRTAIGKRRARFLFGHSGSPVFGIKDNVSALPDDVILFIADQALCTLVPASHPPLEIGGNNRILACVFYH